MLVKGPADPHSSAPLIGALTVVFLGAIAYALPSARLQTELTDAQRGLLVSHAGFGAGLASQANLDGYSYLAVDLTNARSGGIWAEELRAVAKIFPVWGWVDVARSSDLAQVKGVQLNGLFLYGATPEQVTAVADANAGLEIVGVAAGKGPDGFAVTLTPDRFAAEAAETGLPVLLAGGLDMAGVRAARAGVEGDYLVSMIAMR